MASLLNVVLALAGVTSTLGLSLKSKKTPLFNVLATGNKGGQLGCKATECEVCLSCVGADCAGLLRHTQKMGEQCDQCKWSKSMLCWREHMNPSDMDDKFEIYDDAGYCGGCEADDAGCDPTSDKAMAKRAKAVDFFREECSTDSYLKKKCVEDTCTRMCKQKCIDPAEGGLEGISIGCMLKMTACYDDHAGCLMQSVCKNKMVCKAWKDKNCPWPAEKPSDGDDGDDSDDDDSGDDGDDSDDDTGDDGDYSDEGDSSAAGGNYSGDGGMMEGNTSGMAAFVQRHTASLLQKRSKSSTWVQRQSESSKSQAMDSMDSSLRGKCE